ncbi:MAG: metal-dependent hydrolase [Labilithrix sp.]|nr:metal-dependent hydrolase [Labilithrix sp.]
MALAASSVPRSPVPRTPRLGFSRVPRHWFAHGAVGSAAATHVANGVNLLFPAGERFFVRSVRHYLDRLDDPELAAQVKGFFGQEGRHAQAHERFFDTLRDQGYDVDAILGPYERVAYGVLEKNVTPAIRLAVTVALEHFTAIMAEDALKGGVLDHAHPAMRQLLEWHALEELEHKAVAFDVLRAVNPSYALRVAGMAIGALALGGFWIVATRALLAQDGISLREALRDLTRLRKAAEKAGRTVSAKPIFTRVFLRGIAEYLRPGFHPTDKDHAPLVARTLERLTRDGVVPHEEPLPA